MDGDAIDLRSIFGLLRRRLGLVALVVAVALGAAGLALLVLEPVYTATTLILVDPSTKNLLDPDAITAPSGFDSLRVDSEVELVKSDTVLLAVADELALASDAEFAPQPGLGDRLQAFFRLAEPQLPTGEQALQSVIGNLGAAVSVSRRGLTFLIAVDARSGRPDFAAAIANAVARHYIRQQLEAKVAAMLAARDIIQGRLADASAAVAASETAFDRFVEDNIDRIGAATAVDLRAQLRASILSSQLPPDILASLYELQQNAEISRSNYQTLLTRQSDLDTQAALQVADSRIVAAATPPASPSFPNPRLILLLAAVVGIVLGIALALLVENFFGGFTSEPQAGAILRLPVTSTPRQRNGVDALSVADTLLLAPLSVYSESIRRIRVGLDQAIRRIRPPDERPAGGLVIVVSSAAPGEGKTTVALSLARAYALSGLPTLLVDCDLRKPGVHQQLGMEASEGLLEYLVGSEQAVDLKSIMTVDTGSGAQIVLGSRRSDIATDQLIAGRTLTRLIAAARKNFDIVVLDSPPVGPVVDGLYLAGMADAILFVVKWSATPQQEVRSAVAALLAARPDTTPILVALNQRDIKPRTRDAAGPLSPPGRGSG